MNIYLRIINIIEVYVKLDIVQLAKLILRGQNTEIILSMMILIIVDIYNIRDYSIINKGNVPTCRLSETTPSRP